MITINLKDLYPSDSQQQLTDKLNFNFNQMLRLGVGKPGDKGDQGQPGPRGIRGLKGDDGERGNFWYSGTVPPTSDPVMIGSPDPKKENDCYLESKQDGAYIWQYSGSAWSKIVDFRLLIENISGTIQSPFERPTATNWGHVIVPKPASELYNNTMLFASDYQDGIYLGSYATQNYINVSKTQSAFLLGGSIKYSMVLGELEYDTVGGQPDTLNPKIRINNTLRVSCSYDRTSVPFVLGKLDLYEQEDGSQPDDANTGMSFVTRYVSGNSRYSNNAIFGSRSIFNRYVGAANDITLAQVDLSGMMLSNQKASAVALGTNTNVDDLAYYAYLLSSSDITRFYVNNHWLPFRSTDPSKSINLGYYGNAISHWDNLYLRSGIGYSTGNDLKFWRGTDANGYDATASNCAVTITRDGKVAIGNSVSSYAGVGDVDGLAFGTSPVSSGNSNNKAVLHIYDVVDSTTAVAGLAEAGFVVEKKWKYKDATGTKYGAYIHNAVQIDAGASGYTGAPLATGLSIVQDQLSTDLVNGIVPVMAGVNVSVRSGYGSVPVDMVYGVTTGLSFLRPQGQLAGNSSVGSSRLFNAIVPDSVAYGHTYITDTEDGMAANYGFYQDGAKNALNRLEGHLQFGGLGYGYALPYFGTVTGNVIHTLKKSNTPDTGRLMVVSGSNMTLNASTTSADLILAAGPAIGNTYAAAITGGDLYIMGAVVKGTASNSKNPGTVFIEPSTVVDNSSTYGAAVSAGAIAIGYFKAPDSSTGYNIGNVGIGTKTPQEKLQVMGNIALGARENTSELMPNMRKLYVRPGISDNLDTESPGRGTSLMISAGEPNGNNKAGHLYLCSGTDKKSVGLYSYVGATVLAYNPETETNTGYVGIRKDVEIVTGNNYGFNGCVLYPDIHVDINGNVRTNGDIIWGSTADSAGWQPIVYHGGGEYNQTSKVRFFAGSTELKYGSSDLNNSVFRMDFKRIGATAVINFYLYFDNVSDLGINQVVSIAIMPNEYLGDFEKVRAYTTLDTNGFSRYNYEWDLSYAACTVSNGPSGIQHAAFVNAGRATVSNGDIPIGSNVLVINSANEALATRFICGQISVRMLTPNLN